MPFIDYKSDEGHADIIVARNQIFGKKERKKKKKTMNSPLRLHYFSSNFHCIFLLQI